LSVISVFNDKTNPVLQLLGAQITVYILLTLASLIA